jgi:glycosyltransferase involved in cell wall biosynthesis
MISNKVTHVITTIELGGAEKQLLILARNQIMQGLKVEVFYLKGKPELKTKFEDLGVKVNSLLVGKPFILQVTKFRKFIRNNECLVHTHLPQAELVASLACKKKNFIISRHNFEPFWPNKPKLVSVLLSRFITSRAARGIAISNAIKNYLLAAKEISKEFQVSVVYYGFEHEVDNLSDSNKLTNEMLNSTKNFKLGSIGRLVPGKNYPTMLKAVAKIVDVYPTVKFFIVGGGSSKQALIKVCKDLKIESNVIWLGRTEHISEFLSKIDLFIFASKGEGFGLVLLEAMLANKPILAANNSAVPEVLGLNYKGLFSTNDHKLLSDKIIEVMNDKVKSDLLISEYKDQIKFFDPADMADNVLNVYKVAGFLNMFIERN